MTLDNADKTYFRGNEYGGAGPWAGLFRHVLDPAKGTVKRYLLADRGCEFPSCNPKVVGQRHRYIYAATARTRGPNFGPNVGVLKVDASQPEGQVLLLCPFASPVSPPSCPAPYALFDLRCLRTVCWAFALKLAMFLCRCRLWCGVAWRGVVCHVRRATSSSWIATNGDWTVMGVVL